MNRPLLVVFLVVFIDLLGFGIVLPLLPRYSDLYLGGFTESGKGAMLGALYCSFSLMQFLLAPTWGRISDRFGRRPVLLVSLAGSVAFYALFAVASTFEKEQATLALTLLLISRIGAGIAGASVSTAAAVVADTTPPEQRSKRMGMVIGGAFGLGFTFGPLIAYGGMKLFPGERWAPGAVAAVLSFVALVTAVLLFKETRTVVGTASGREFFSVARTIEVLRMPAIGPVVLVYFLVIFAFANFEGTLSVFTEAAFNLTDDDNFLVFAYVGAVLLFAQGGLYRRFAGRMPDERLIMLGVALMLLGMLGLTAVAYFASVLVGATTIAGLKPMFYLALAAAVTGFGFVNPSVSSLVSKRAEPGRQGEVQGVNQSFSALGRILGPFVGLMAFHWHPSRALPYVVAGALLIGVTMLLPMVRRNENARG
jgi:DHA1 family tetracycline resistance protein-like MFS transporter